MTPETPREKWLDLQNLTWPNWHILLWKWLQKCLEKRGWTFKISPGLTGIYCYENASRNASKKKVGPSKSHPAKLAYIVMKMTPETPREKRLDLRNLTRPNWHKLLWKWLQKRLEKSGWTFKISPGLTGIYCKKNDSRNASRKEVGPLKSHLLKLAYIAMKMPQETPREKRLDLRNLTLQNWHILLWKWLKKRL